MGRKSFYILSFGFAFSTLNYKFASTLVERALQIHLFLTNKPNFRKSQMNVNKVLTKDYDKMDTWSNGKNKPNSNPKRTQTNPIKAQKMQKQTQYKPNSNPNKANFRVKERITKAR
jgi:hypothetical protein